MQSHTIDILKLWRHSDIANKKGFKVCVRSFSFLPPEVNIFFAALKKIRNMFFILSKKRFSSSRYSNCCISNFPQFFLDSHSLRWWFRINIKVFHVRNWPNKDLITHFVWYLEKKKRYDIDRVLSKGHFYGKIMQKLCTKNESETPF